MKIWFGFIKKFFYSSVNFLNPHLQQVLLWTQIVLLHSGHSYFFSCFLRNFSIPFSLISFRFLIMLISYFFLYLSSSFCNFSHGNFSHSKQYFIFSFESFSQFFWEKHNFFSYLASRALRFLSAKKSHAYSAIHSA